ncbi:AMP-binding enzyme [Micromonospora inyonensis]|uniref:AMP-binding enzyme n=1 Tax=Micromonospora inyonensis TaxID=47866 RepID=A0A1C6SFX5_9ACTN|nr:AMP-binding protein [Micromonospora inyonensis]SCL28313.1 AMP-binding enzyme [Micromonospora inyonensis]
MPADGESVGELSIRGPTLFSGYVGQPDQVTPGDGWHATGDLATVAPDGCHRILGRRRADVVHCRNQAVPARQVEEVLLTHPGVHDVAVVGAPRRALGEMIVAYVVAADGPPRRPPVADPYRRVAGDASGVGAGRRGA